MQILGIETSCDETGIALFDSERGIVAEALHSQTPVHEPYGGVVPELASRDHIRMILPLIDQTLEQAAARREDLDAVAYTCGPGLAGALLVGAAIGRSIAYALDVPAIEVHHMEAHLLAPMLEGHKPEPPFLALLVSGGHTQLVQAQAGRTYRTLGQSLDDAVGEAFDKTAKLLGLPYPGGAPLSALAEQGNPDRFHFPRPMTEQPGLDFSFSGLKTHAMLTFREHEGKDPSCRADIARAFVDAVVDTLTIKCERAMLETGLRTCVVAGGVSANRQLRAALGSLGSRLSARFVFPRLRWCTDNGAMIAYAGWLQWQMSQGLGCEQARRFQPRPRWELDSLSS